MSPVGLKRWAGPALALALGGCAALPGTEPATGPAVEAAWDAHRARIEPVERWSLTGRVAVRHDDEGWNAQLRWRQRGPRYELYLSAPFGQGSVRLAGGPRGVVMETSEGERYVASEADELLARWVGADVPVEALRYWIRGLPQPGVEASRRRLDADGRLLDLRQRAWAVEYAGYTETDGLALPRKLTASDDGLRVRLVIDQWSLDRTRAAGVDD